MEGGKSQRSAIESVIVENISAVTRREDCTSEQVKCQVSFLLLHTQPLTC